MQHFFSIDDDNNKINSREFRKIAKTKMIIYKKKKTKKQKKNIFINNKLINQLG